MLDTNLKEQLSTLFKPISGKIVFEVYRSTHEQQKELLDMLNELSVVSSKMAVRLNEASAKVPTFSLLYNDTHTGITFQGVPGGHEFSSLILAVLNSAGLGKLPDVGLTQRIKRLKSGLQIKTYVSLSCENCPDVVQAMNQIALAHGSIEHRTIDGGLVQDELAQLKIQGVPSVLVEDELLHSGRATLIDLLTKLENKFGQAPSNVAENLGHFDVAVIGGGPAGASAAIYSARKGLRTVLIAEKIGGQVQETKGIENLISVIYTEGPQLSSSMEQHLRTYPVKIMEHRRVKSVGVGDKKILQLDSGETLSYEALIVATGAKWRELGVPGEKEYLGRGVAFCPHCDGPYYKGKKVAVVGGGNSGVEAAIDLAGLCSEVVLIEYLDQLKADQVLVQKLKSLSNVTVITAARTEEIMGDGEKVIGLKFQDRSTEAVKELTIDGIFVQIGLSPNSAVVKDVVETNRYGEIVIDAKGRTNTPGIYAAGDVTTVPFKQIIIAMGEGAKVALTAFEDRMRA